MNIIKLCGGLGNQIFQYAFGKAQMSNGIDVQFDKTWFGGKYAQNPLRLYLLDKFRIDVEYSPRHGKVISEKGFDLELLHKDGFYFSGYWQCPAYSESVIDDLRKELRVKKELYTRAFLDLRQRIILDDFSIGVHVRRGDYTYLNGFPLMPIEYYQKALEIVKGNVYVFSDDMEWCRTKFPGSTQIHLNEYFDFELMKLCKHQVLSRSSFGWWAAHLNTNPDKLVIVPKQQIDIKFLPESEKDKQG